MTLDLATTLLAAAAVLVGAFLQRVSGTGVGLVVSPTLALLIGPVAGVFATNIVTITSGLLLTIVRWHEIDWYRARWLIGWAIPGAAAGAVLVRELPAAWLQVVIGTTVVVALILTYIASEPRRTDGRPQLVTAGTIGGALNTACGVAAPAMVIYSRFAHWRQPSFGATMQPVFMSMGVLSVGFKTALGVVGGAQPLPAWWYLPAVIVVVLLGVWIGSIAAKRISAQAAQVVAVALSGLGGVSVLVRGLIALLS